MPEGLIENSARYVYPRADNVYGSEDYDNRTVTFTSSNDRNAYTRSSNNNKLYYNPQQSYRPWAKADGTLMANASISCAPHNPFNTAAGCRDLTKNNRSKSLRYYTGFSSTDYNDDETFWPAVYFAYKGSGDVKKVGSYTRVEIKSGSTYGGRPNRSDCKSAPFVPMTRRSRTSPTGTPTTAPGSWRLVPGSYRAFASQGQALRVGFATINASGSVIRGVAPFPARIAVPFQRPLQPRYSGRHAAAYQPEGCGEYFSRTDNNGPWAASAGSTLPHLTCRQSYNILMTDGY